MEMETSKHPIQILLVDDNRADVRLAREALREAAVESCLEVAGDGVEAMSYLRREGPHASAPRPDIILLDLNMPRKSGLEVLAEMKADPQLRRIPVVVLSTSTEPSDIGKAYDLQASFYINKPADLDEFVEAMRSFEQLCLRFAQLPPRD